MSIFLDETAVHCTGELTRKHIAEAFWNSEVESELRLHGDITFKFKERLDREKFMDAVDQERASHPYPPYTMFKRMSQARYINQLTYYNYFKINYYIYLFTL